MLQKSRDLFRRLLVMCPADAIETIRKELGYDRFIEHRLSGFSKISAYQKLAVLTQVASGIKRPVELNARLAALSLAVRESADPEASVVFLPFIPQGNGI